MTSYTEEIYERAENLFTSDSAKLAWLSSFERPEKGETDYTKDALKVRDTLVSFETIKLDTPKTRNLKELKDIQKDANKLEFDDLKDEALGLINNQIAILEGEAEEEKQKFKEAELRKEREEAEERLREL
ncbi:MAG: hypothetical protein KKB31_04410, partial [Nanoarchaeota archaeon]|nr:hypothetical protein [Nanoarchaeota archaeon]